MGFQNENSETLRYLIILRGKAFKISSQLCNRDWKQSSLGQPEVHTVNSGYTIDLSNWGPVLRVLQIFLCIYLKPIVNTPRVLPEVYFEMEIQLKELLHSPNIEYLDKICQQKLNILLSSKEGGNS